MPGAGAPLLSFASMTDETMRCIWNQRSNKVWQYVIWCQHACVALGRAVFLDILDFCARVLATQNTNGGDDDPRQNSSELILVPAPATIGTCSSC